MNDSHDQDQEPHGTRDTFVPAPAKAKYAQRQFVFIRGRISQCASNVPSMAGSNEWMVIPVDSAGRDVDSGGVLFVSETSLVSVDEAKSIVRKAK